jgi:ribosome-binding protein aMBF1 (putative translation factor)
MSLQDWTPVIINNHSKKNIQKKIIKKDVYKNNSLKKLEEDTENFSHQKIPLLLSKEITNARIAKKLTQKEMSIKLNVQSNLYNDIENGKALYNQETKKIINKLQNLLNVKFSK